MICKIKIKKKEEKNPKIKQDETKSEFKNYFF